MPSVVRFENVSYNVFDRPVLRNIDFEVPPGETLVLLGRSGSGKTTALKMVNALLYPASGAVLVDGKATTAWNPVALRRRIGYVIQDVGLFPHWTVAANIGLVPGLEGWLAPHVDERVRELLSAIGMSGMDYPSRRPRQLSGGQKQRVGVARALAADPPLLLFDEPFGALDPITRFELQRLFLDLRERFRKTSLFVTHDLNEAMLVGSRIALLADGRMEWLGPASDFARADSPHAREFLACFNPRL